MQLNVWVNLSECGDPHLRVASAWKLLTETHLTLELDDFMETHLKTVA